MSLRYRLRRQKKLELLKYKTSVIKKKTAKSNSSKRQEKTFQPLLDESETSDEENETSDTESDAHSIDEYEAPPSFAERLKLEEEYIEYLSQKEKKIFESLFNKYENNTREDIIDLQTLKIQIADEDIWTSLKPDHLSVPVYDFDDRSVAHMQKLQAWAKADRRANRVCKLTEEITLLAEDQLGNSTGTPPNNSSKSFKETLIQPDCSKRASEYSSNFGNCVKKAIDDYDHQVVRTKDCTVVLNRIDLRDDNPEVSNSSYQIKSHSNTYNPNLCRNNNPEISSIEMQNKSKNSNSLFSELKSADETVILKTPQHNRISKGNKYLLRRKTNEKNSASVLKDDSIYSLGNDFSLGYNISSKELNPVTPKVRHKEYEKNSASALKDDSIYSLGNDFSLGYNISSKELNPVTPKVRHKEYEKNSASTFKDDSICSLGNDFSLGYNIYSKELNPVTPKVRHKEYEKNSASTFRDDSICSLGNDFSLGYNISSKELNPVTPKVQHKEYSATVLKEPVVHKFKACRKNPIDTICSLGNEFNLECYSSNLCSRVLNRNAQNTLSSMTPKIVSKKESIKNKSYYSTISVDDLLMENLNLSTPGRPKEAVVKKKWNNPTTNNPVDDESLKTVPLSSPRKSLQQKFPVKKVEYCPKNVPIFAKTRSGVRKQKVNDSTYNPVYGDSLETVSSSTPQNVLRNIFSDKNIKYSLRTVPEDTITKIEKKNRQPATKKPGDNDSMKTVSSSSSRNICLDKIFKYSPKTVPEDTITKIEVIEKEIKQLGKKKPGTDDSTKTVPFSIPQNHLQRENLKRNPEYLHVPIDSRLTL